MDILISSEYDGRSVLSYLKNELKLSSAYISSLKNIERGIEVNRAHVTVKYLLREGDLLSISDAEPRPSENIVPSDIPLDILYEDGNIIILNKPPYMPTHPSHNHYDDTLANGLANLYLKRGEPFVFRPMGRLDRNTSGIVTVAKNRAAASFIFNASKKGSIQKHYIAILDGECAQPVGNINVIDTPIKRQDGSIISRVACDINENGAQKALTYWRTLYSKNGITLAHAFPKTGRTHQLRVHFSSIGLPLLGDDMYGIPSNIIGRHSLHAAAIELPLPFDGSILKITAPIPEDMNSAFSTLSGISIDSLRISD